MSELGKAELVTARRKASGLLGSVFVFSVFVNLLMLTGPLFMLQVYDRVLGSRSEETLVALFVLVAVLFGLMGILDYARGRVLARFGARFQTSLDDRVFRAVLKQSLNPKFRNSPVAGLRDLETIQATLTSPAMLALFDVPWTPLFVAAIFVFHPVLGWMAVAGGGLLIVVTLLNNWLTRAKTAEAQSASQQAHSFADQARHSAELIRAQGMTTAVANRWHALRENGLDQTMGASDWTGLFSAMTKAFRMFLQSTMLAVGAWLVLQGEMTAGAMIAGSILLGRALAPIEQTIGQWPVVVRSLAGWRELGGLLRATPPEAPAVSLPRPAARVAVKNLGVFAPDTSQPVLSGINLDIPAGSVVGIIGKSGSGKSTLAKTLMGIIQPANGEVRLGGATLTQYDLDEFGKYVGYLPQNVTLFSGTIAENIARMSEAPDDEKVVEAAQRANAHDMILSLPDGYQTIVHGQDSQLSGGQKQRIALARALYDDPVLLVLDEPNSALDAEGSEALNKAVRSFKSTDRTVIIMTHRPMAIAECDRLVVIDAGRIKADGPRDEVLQSSLKNKDKVKQTLRQGATA